MSAKDERSAISSTSTVASPVLQSSTSGTGKPPSALIEQQPPSPSLPLVSQINTPQHERGRSLYPTTLAKSSQSQGPGGRIPLHRRGTSRTYERLEDLLREAGYKETRVFTPENERHKTGDGGDDYDENGRRKQERNGSNVSAVVNFLSGLISTIPGSGIGIGGVSADSSSSAATSAGNSLRSQSQSTGETSISEHKPLQAQDPSVVRIEDIWTPPSPTPSSKPNSGKQRRQWHGQQGTSSQDGSQSSTGTLKARPPPGTPQKLSLALDSLRRHSAAVVSTTISPNSIPAIAQAPSSRSQPNISSLSNPNVKGRSARPHLKASQTSSPPQTQMQTQTHAPLRHMSSVPTIPRPGSAPPIKQHKQIRRLTNADASTNTPPLPTNWLLNVTKAVINASSAGAGVYIGGPTKAFSGSNTSLISNSTAGGSGQDKLSRANSETGRGRGRGRDRAIVDRTGYVRPRGRLLNAEEAKRLRPTTPLFDVKPGVLGENAVTTTNVNVVCRSAPASRTTSRVRGGNGSRNQSRKRSKHPSDRNGKEMDNLPSLGVTTIEGVDGADPSLLASLLLALPQTPNLNGRMIGVGTGAGGETSEDEDEDEGDIDLAKILVPSKRQRSIASLRRCLWRGGVILPSNADGRGSRMSSRPQSRLGQGYNKDHRPAYAKDGRWTYSWRSAAPTSASQSRSSLEVEGSKQGYFSVPPSPAPKGGRFGDMEAIDPPGLGNTTSTDPVMESLPAAKIRSSANSSNIHSRQHSRQHSASLSVAPSVSASVAKIANTSPDPDDSFVQALERDFQRQRRGSIDMDEEEWRGLERLELPGFGKDSQAELKKRGAIPGWLWS